MKLFIVFTSSILLCAICAAQPSLDDLDDKLDSIITFGLDSQAYPGAQILVRHKNEIIYHNTWGHHTYENIRSVQADDLYDMASVTKVTTCLPVLMQLYGAGVIDIDAPIGTYIAPLKRGNKKEITLRQILAHQSRLEPYIVFWAKTLKKNGKFKRNTFRTNHSKNYPIQITDELFLHKNYKRKMERAIRNSKLKEETEYLYSGLIFLLLPEMIENIVQRPFEEYLYEKIYNPIQARSLTYNPKEKYALENIIPTEYDSFWRQQLVHGTVHDEAAAMLEGISCNAGLFGNAKDLSILFQLYLNRGTWNGQKIISPQSINIFTSYQYANNRRGLGFDKPPLEYREGESYIAESASPRSYGHSGFTGTFVWADPARDLIVIFLSNRVHPDRSHRQLYALNIRPQIHQAVYEYICEL